MRDIEQCHQVSVQVTAMRKSWVLLGYGALLQRLDRWRHWTVLLSSVQRSHLYWTWWLQQAFGICRIHNIWLVYYHLEHYRAQGIITGIWLYLSHHAAVQTGNKPQPHKGPAPVGPENWQKPDTASNSPGSTKKETKPRPAIQQEAS